MNLLKWFICWVADNRNKYLPIELEEFDILIKRIKMELEDDSGSNNFSIRSKEYQQRSSELSQSKDVKTSLQDSCVNEVNEEEMDVSNYVNRDIFLALVKIYLKDAKQINLSFQSFRADSPFISEEEPQLDNGSNGKDKLVCSNQPTELDLDSNSCKLASEEKNGDEMDNNPEMRHAQTNCLNTENNNASSKRRTSASSLAVESFKKLRHIRQELKKLAVNLKTFDKNTEANVIIHLNHELNSNRLKLDAIECNENERMNAARETLINQIQELISRLKTIIPSSSSASDKPTPDSAYLTASPLERIEDVQKLAERIKLDTKLYMFDSHADKDFINFDEKLTNCLIQLDCIQCEGDRFLLAARKKVIKYIEELICCLEVKVIFDSFLTNNIEDPSDLITKGEALQRIRDVESLAENLEYLIGLSTSNLHSDENFSTLDKMISKCLTQLDYIECQDDEQLLNEQQRVADYVNKLVTHLENTFSSNLTSNNPCDEQVSHSATTISKDLKSIEEVEQESERLKFHIEFGCFESRTDRIYVYVEEMLTKLLISLDSISCNGNERMRIARKKAVQFIYQLTENLEAKVPS